MLNKIKKLEIVLKELVDGDSVDLNVKLVLGKIVGDLRNHGYLEPDLEFKGDLCLKKVLSGYDIVFENNKKIQIQSDNSWSYKIKPMLSYAKSLRRKLANKSHLMLYLSDKDYQFAILYYPELKHSFKS